MIFGRGYESTASDAFRSVSAFGVVPVIDDAGFILRESQAIVRYLATKHGRADLFPDEMRERFRVEAWMDWATTDVYQEVRPAFQGLVFKLPEFDDPKIIANAITGWTRQMERLEAQLRADGPYMAGPEFTIADIPIGLIVNRWYMTPFDKPDLPTIADYYALLKERPAYLEHGANGLP
jgi:glutathione S-transferase